MANAIGIKTRSAKKDEILESESELKNLLFSEEFSRFISEIVDKVVKEKTAVLIAAIKELESTNLKLVDEVAKLSEVKPREVQQIPKIATNNESTNAAAVSSNNAKSKPDFVEKGKLKEKLPSGETSRDQTQGIGPPSESDPLEDTEGFTTVQYNRNQRRQKIIRGTAEVHEKLQAVEKKLWVYLGGTKPNTETKDVEDFLLEKFPQNKFAVVQLPTKDRHNSFRIEADLQLKEAIYQTSLWPTGCFLKRFRFPRHAGDFKSRQT